ncbi:hypothetical protein COB57_02380 [Candidatus Peregrinibacteria bacterium]|nr:MAG: hypothetical protein COB57_02380 [Candidatus Peregrinibacteria bacterium]
MSGVNKKNNLIEADSEFTSKKTSEVVLVNQEIKNNFKALKLLKTQKKLEEREREKNIKEEFFRYVLDGEYKEIKSDQKDLMIRLVSQELRISYNFPDIEKNRSMLKDVMNSEFLTLSTAPFDGMNDDDFYISEVRCCNDIEYLKSCDDINMTRETVSKVACLQSMRLKKPISSPWLSELQQRALMYRKMLEVKAREHNFVMKKKEKSVTALILEDPLFLLSLPDSDDLSVAQMGLRANDQVLAILDPESVERYDLKNWLWEDRKAHVEELLFAELCGMDWMIELKNNRRKFIYHMEYAFDLVEDEVGMRRLLEIFLILNIEIKEVMCDARGEKKEWSDYELLMNEYRSIQENNGEMFAAIVDGVCFSVGGIDCVYYRAYRRMMDDIISKEVDVCDLPDYESDMFDDIDVIIALRTNTVNEFEKKCKAF